MWLESFDIVFRLQVVIETFGSLKPRRPTYLRDLWYTKNTSKIDQRSLQATSLEKVKCILDKRINGTISTQCYLFNAQVDILTKIGELIFYKKYQLGQISTEQQMVQ